MLSLVEAFLGIFSRIYIRFRPRVELRRRQMLWAELLQKWQRDFFEALHDCVCFAEQLGWM